MTRGDLVVAVASAWFAAVGVLVVVAGAVLRARRRAARRDEDAAAPLATSVDDER